MATQGARDVWALAAESPARGGRQAGTTRRVIKTWLPQHSSSAKHACPRSRCLPSALHATARLPLIKPQPPTSRPWQGKPGTIRSACLRVFRFLEKSFWKFAFGLFVTLLHLFSRSFSVRRSHNLSRAALWSCLRAHWERGWWNFFTKEPAEKALSRGQTAGYVNRCSVLETRSEPWTSDYYCTGNKILTIGLSARARKEERERGKKRTRAQERVREKDKYIKSTAWIFEYPKYKDFDHSQYCGLRALFYGRKGTSLPHTDATHFDYKIK